MKVRKRNGNVVDFDGEKIVVAVKKAMAETDKGVDEEAARAVANEVTEKCEGTETVDIEAIQDAVEISLMTKEMRSHRRNYQMVHFLLVCMNIKMHRWTTAKSKNFRS